MCVCVCVYMCIYMYLRDFLVSPVVKILPFQYKGDRFSP